MATEAFTVRAETDVVHQLDDIPGNVFGRSREFSMKVRQRYELLFELIQKSGLRISEALNLKVSDIRVIDGVAAWDLPVERDLHFKADKTLSQYADEAQRIKS